MKAGRIAEQKSSTKVKVEHVKDIIKEVVRAKPHIIKDNLNYIEKDILKIIEENNDLAFNELHKKYCETSESSITEKPFLNYVKHLNELKLIEIKKRKDNGKRIIGKI